MIYSKPIFEVIAGDRHYKIFANGKTEGFDEPHYIINRCRSYFHAMLEYYDNRSKSPTSPHSSPTSSFDGASQGTPE
jgi:hypothetical protein